MRKLNQKNKDDCYIWSIATIYYQAIIITGKNSLLQWQEQVISWIKNVKGGKGLKIIYIYPCTNKTQ